MSVTRLSKLGVAAPPIHSRRPQTRVVHGVSLADDYAWMRADDWRAALADPSALPDETRAALEAENSYADAVLAPTAGLRERLTAEMRARIREDEASAAAPDGPFAYFTRHKPGGQHPLYCRAPRVGGAESVLLDVDQEAGGRAFFRVRGVSHSPDHRLLAWAADMKGDERHIIRVRDLTQGVDAARVVEDAEGGVVWAPDSKSFLYVALDEAHRPTRVMRHHLNGALDELIFEDRDSRYFVSLDVTRSHRFAVISTHDHDSTESYILDLEEPSARPRLVAARREGVRYDVEHHNERLILRVGAPDAVDFKLVEAPLSAPSQWRDLVSPEAGRMIIDLVVLRDWIVTLERMNALPRICVRDVASGEAHLIAFEEAAYSLSFDRMFEFDTDVLRFSYSSPSRPREVWDYDMRSRARTMRWRQEIPSGYDPQNYVVRRIEAVSHDGARVPVTLLHHKGMTFDGQGPALLYGYGAYGSSTPAAFTQRLISLADRGFVCAIAHVRGGADKGFGWYLDGKLEKKENTFLDFLASARALIEIGAARQGRVVAHGGSAGGLLMGAIANMAPELFGAVIADVPFVDVVNTMLDESLPLTPPEWREWGDPIRDEAAFRRMLGYSPYDNVEAQTYPPILALAGVSDPRVTYWEPAKWVARLRERMTGGGPIILRVNMNAGHAGAAGRFDRIEEIAEQYAFAIAAVGAPEEPIIFDR
jgi:oligopeptidase B